jgi:hypothetical protein
MKMNDVKIYLANDTRAMRQDTFWSMVLAIKSLSIHVWL